MLLLSHVLLLYPRASLLEDPYSLAMELRMMGLHGLLARAQITQRAPLCRGARLAAPQPGPGHRQGVLLQPGGPGDDPGAPEREVRGSSLSLLARQYGASEEEARQWKANALFSRFKYSVS